MVGTGGQQGVCSAAAMLAPLLAASALAAAAPIYRDPLFDGAHDPEIVYHRAEGCCEAPAHPHPTSRYDTGQRGPTVAAALPCLRH